RDPQRAKNLLKTAVEFLPLVSPRTLKQSDQQHHISHVAGITSRAVSLSLQCRDKPYDALQLLELGRGVLANMWLEVRSDVSALKISNPELAEQFDDIRNRLDSSSGNILLQI